MSHSLSPAQFQSFEVRTTKTTVAPRVAALRERMTAHKVDAFLVPRADVYRGENVPASEERLAYITSFTGSAGQAIVSARAAALFVDGRYTIQAPEQTDTAIFTLKSIPDDTAADWIKEQLPEGAVVGYDSWLHTTSEIAALAEALDDHAVLTPVPNLIDEVWTDRPAPPVGPIEVLGLNRAGKSVDAKLADLSQILGKNHADALILNVPESICWLLNIRGRDVPHVPVAHGFAIVPRGGRPSLFIDANKLTADIRNQIEQNADIRPLSDFSGAIEDCARGGKLVWLDPTSAPQAAKHLIEGVKGKVLSKADPTHHAKTIKNEVECAGMREAQRRDAVAMANFLHWFDQQVDAGQTLTEIDVAEAVEHFRKQDDTLVDISFESISASGPHAAIPHYRVTSDSNRTLIPGELMLIDSGAQFLSGTTDITRTMWSGPVDDIKKDHFTRVLKGMIGISTLIFPKSAHGGHIDMIARKALWDVGLNYNHGTGHGIGAFLAVHESPPGIAPRYTMLFEPGMIVSNEPGYYAEGSHGIRTENLILVEEAPNYPGFLQFETLTLTPIDTRLVLIDLLTPQEREWLNAYHRRVVDEIGPYLAADVKAWLIKACAPV